jgi:hypothetical protein
MAGRKYSNQMGDMARANVTSAVSEEVERQASEGVLGKYSPRALILRGTNALLGVGSSDRARAIRSGIKANKIKQSRKK